MDIQKQHNAKTQKQIQQGPFQQIEQQQKDSYSIHLQMLNHINVHPQPIQFISYYSSKQSKNNNIPIFNTNRLYVVRQSILQVHVYHYQNNHKINKNKNQKINQNNQNNQINTQHLFTLHLPSKIISLYQIDNVLFAISHYQVYTLQIQSLNNTNFNWEAHPLTTQILSSQILTIKSKQSWVTQQSLLYTYHQKETMKWYIDQDKIRYQYLSQRQQPFHINALGQIEGQGKKAKSLKKGVKFTASAILQSSNGNKNKSKVPFSSKDILFVGDSQGSLHIYQCQYLTKILTIKKHIAAILSIKVNQQTQKVYWTGSDSKICCLGKIFKSQNSQEWQVTSQTRGQSHDILSLQLCGSDVLVSGGLTTDLCFYKLQNNQLSSQLIEHRVGYSIDQITSLYQNKQYSLLLVNRYKKMELWKIINNQKFQLQFNYTISTSSPKIIKAAKISPQQISQFDNQTQQNFIYNYLILLTSQETVCFKYNSDVGLQRIFAIQHSYQFIDFYDKHSIICIRNSTSQEIEKVDCRTGKMQILSDQLEIGLITEMKIHSKKDYIINKDLHEENQQYFMGGKKRIDFQTIQPFFIRNNNKVPKILLLGSKFTNTLILFNLKSKKIIKKINISQFYAKNENSKRENEFIVPYTFLHIDLNYKATALTHKIDKLSIVTKFFGQSSLIVTKLSIQNKNKKEDKLEKVNDNLYDERYQVQLPLKRVRFAGWLTLPYITCTTVKLKRYFYLISQGKALIVSNILSANKKKKIRSKQMDRIGTVIGSTLKSFNEHSQQENNLGQSLLLLCMNLKETVSAGKGAIINKKVRY